MKTTVHQKDKLPKRINLPSLL